MRACVVLLLCLPILAAPREVIAPRCAAAPTLDGRLDDACWQAGAWSGDFVQLGQADRAATAATSFQVAHDAQRLYLAVRCEEPAMDRLRATATDRDGKVFRDDVVEIFLDADGDQVSHVHVAINALGTIYDSEVRQGGHVHAPEWDAGVVAATQRGPAGWTLEVALPLAELGLSDRSRQPWGLNVARERQAVTPAELTTFVPLNGGFHQPSLFARLTLRDADLGPFLWAVRTPYAVQVTEQDGHLTLQARTWLLNQTGRFRFYRLTAALVGPGGRTTQEVTGGLDAGQGREVSLAVPVAAQGPAQLVLTIADRLGGDVWAVHQSAQVVRYTPLAITLRQPAWRHTIYATERVAEVRGEVRFGLPADALAGRSLRVALLTATRVVAETTLPAVAPQTPFTLPAGELPVGEHVLVAELRDGGRVLHEAREPLHRAPPVAHEIRLDEHQVLRINGQPTLIFGWFSAPPSAYAELVAAGYNAIVDYTAQYRDLATERAFLDEAWAAGLRVLFYPYPKAAMLDAAAMGQPLSDAEAAAIRERVRALKDHPGVLGWYLADEPELRPALPERLADIRRVIAAEDPFHPCVMLNDSIAGIGRYREGGDVLMPDPYPLFVKGGHAARDLGYTTAFMRAAAEAAEGWRGVWITPQAFNYGDYGRLNNRAPNLAELRSQWYQAVICGATGALWYTYSHSANYPSIGLGLPYLARESRALEPWLLALEGARAVTCEPATGLTATLRTLPAGSLLVAAYTGLEPVEATLALPAGTPGTWHVVGEERQVSAREGRLRDRFEPYATHLYCTSAAVARTASLAAVEAAIAAADAARRKPGNLLFEDLGGTVTVSGNARFSSVPERVLDGVVGGLAWRDGTPGKGPDWLAIKLAAPAALGRVVVWSPDLTTGVVQAADGEAWRDLAPLQRVDAGRLEAVFAPRAVAALRVLVTQGAGQDVSISEVEAYAR